MTDIQSDYDLLMARVESGELGAGNLVAMILNQREAHAGQRLETQHWQVLYNEVRASIPYAFTVTGNEELVELILWLALPWADNDPIFPESDGWTPRALEANTRMKRTWQRVVRSPGAVPEEVKEPHGTE